MNHSTLPSAPPKSYTYSPSYTNLPPSCFRNRFSFVSRTFVFSHQCLTRNPIYDDYETHTFALCCFINEWEMRRCGHLLLLLLPSWCCVWNSNYVPCCARCFDDERLMMLRGLLKMDDDGMLRRWWWWMKNYEITCMAIHYLLVDVVIYSCVLILTFYMFVMFSVDATGTRWMENISLFLNLCCIFRNFWYHIQTTELQILSISSPTQWKDQSFNLQVGYIAKHSSPWNSFTTPCISKVVNCRSKLQIVYVHRWCQRPLDTWASLTRRYEVVRAFYGCWKEGWVLCELRTRWRRHIQSGGVAARRFGRERRWILWGSF